MELTDKQKNMVENFSWTDDQEESEVHLDGFEFCKSLEECAQNILEYVLKNIEISRYTGISFVIPIQASFHPFLQSTYDPQWSTESRMRARESLFLVFKGMVADQTVKGELHEKFCALLPINTSDIPTSSYVSEIEVTIVDNPECQIWDDTKSDEVKKDEIKEIEYPVQVEVFRKVYAFANINKGECKEKLYNI